MKYNWGMLLFRLRLLTLLMAALLSVFLLFQVDARAADIPVKAPPLVGLQYPQANGLILELWTGGGGGPVTAQVPGVPAASLTTTTAGIGATVGWMWTPNRGGISISLEGDISAQNFNGNNAGFSLQGPLAFEQRVMFFTSAANVQAIFTALPNFPNPFSQISAFSIPNGFAGTGKNLLGAGFFVREADISTAYLGVQSNKVWRTNPGFVVMAVQPLTNGGAFREAVEFDFNNAGKVFGQVPVGQTAATLGTGVRARVGYAF